MTEEHDSRTDEEEEESLGLFRVSFRQRRTCPLLSFYDTVFRKYLLFFFCPKYLHIYGIIFLFFLSFPGYACFG